VCMRLRGKGPAQTLTLPEQAMSYSTSVKVGLPMEVMA